jgi:hypothetical protein
MCCNRAGENTLGFTMPTLEEVQKRFTDELRHVDDVAQIVLKGHLVMEELMTASIETFLLHGEFVEPSRLQFHQKLQLCRAMSVSDHNNDMWNLIASINTLRNHLSHSLDPTERAKRVEALGSKFAREFPAHISEKLDPLPHEAATCMLAIAGALGFLHAHAAEVRRFREVVLDVDKGLNNGRLGEA